VPFPDEEINPGGGMGRDGLLKLLRPPPWGFFFGVKSRSLIFVFFLVVSFFSTYVGPWSLYCSVAILFAIAT